MRVLVWVLRALVFFTLFAFASTIGDATLRWFFGYEWRAPTMVVVPRRSRWLRLALAMVPRWWRQLRAARRQVPPSTATVPSETPAVQSSALEPAPVHPPRDGL
jgi:hypothetical protein